MLADSSSCYNLCVLFTCVYMHALFPFSGPVRAPGHNAPLSHLVISVLIISFACLHRLLSHLSFFLNFSLTYLLPYLFL